MALTVSQVYIQKILLQYREPREAKHLLYFCWLLADEVVNCDVVDWSSGHTLILPCPN